MDLWVDDIRLPPGKNWVWAKTAHLAIDLLSLVHFECVSLDHDLGMGDEEDGYRVALWMAEHDVWPDEVVVHSMNPVGAHRIQGVVDRYGPYDKPCERVWYADDPALPLDEG